MDMLKIGETIKAKRKERDLTQEELAAILGVTKAAVSKWENTESYPDITMLPQIAQLFHITMDELFGYSLEFKPLKIVNEINFGIPLSFLEDQSVLDHGTIKESGVHKRNYQVGDKIESVWEASVHIISNEDDFPYILQKCIKPNVLIDGYSYRLADGKIIDDDKPNKHYVCKEKVWEYNITNGKHGKYLKEMLKEQAAMGLIDDYD